MGNVTLGLSDSGESRLRRLAKKRYGNKKGALSLIVEDGLVQLEENHDRERARERLIANMENGFDGGAWKFKNRSELYDRFEGHKKN